MRIRQLVRKALLVLGAMSVACAPTALASTSTRATTAARQQPSPSADQVTVPLSDPSRPGLIDVSLVQGSITVRGANRKDVLVIARGETDRPSRRYDPDATGMRRIPQTAGFRITEDANRSVSDAMRLNFMENRIAPLCRRLESAIQPLINKMVGTDRRAVRGQFHLASTPIMQSAQRARIDTATKLFSMGIPLNIINQNLDLGLPKLPHGDKAYLPTKLQEVGPSDLGEGPQREPEPQEDDDPADLSRHTDVAAADRCLRLLPLLKLNGHVAADVRRLK